MSPPPAPPLWRRRNLRNRRWAPPFTSTHQFAYPVSDISAGSWVPSTGTDLFAVLDESVPDDSDYIESSATPTLDTAKLQLESLTTPDPTEPIIFRIWHQLIP